MPVEFEPLDLDEIVQRLISDCPELRSLAGDETAPIAIKCLSKVKTDKNDELVSAGKGAPITMEAVNDKFKALGVECDLLIIVDSYFWSANHIGQVHKMSRLHHAMMGLTAELQETGEYKFSKRPYSVTEYKETLRRYANDPELRPLISEIAEASRQFTETIYEDTEAFDEDNESESEAA